MIRSRLLIRGAFGAAVALLFLASAAAALQASGAPSLRPYWHVFAAYTLAIVLIGGWAISIARRLRDVEERLTD